MSVPSTESIRVLHVDDDPDFVEMAAESLEREDGRFAVETATSADDGLDRLAEGEYDCVVSDHDMPGTNGIEFLQAVREMDPDLPFVLFTGGGSEALASDAISAGVTDYLRKGRETGQYELLANRIGNAVSQVRTERRLRELTEATNDVLWMFDGDWSDLLFINSAYEGIWGRPAEALADHPRDFLNGVHPDDRDRVREAMNALSAGESLEIEYRVNADEDYGRWVWIRGEPIVDENGDVVRVAGVARDITKRKRRERGIDELHETAREFTETETFEDVADLAVEAVQDILDVPNCRVHLYDEVEDCLPPVAWTERTETVVGDPPTFAPGEGLPGKAFEAGEPRTYDDVSTVPERSTPDTGVRSRIILPLDGYGVLLIGSPEPNRFDETDVSLTRTLAAHVTTTLDRIERERDLEEYRTIVEAVGDPVYALDADGRYTFVNDAFVDETGYSKGEILGEHVSLTLTEDSLEKGRETIRDLLAEDGRTKATIELERITSDGERIPSENTIALLPTDEQGRFRGSAGVVRDIAERKSRERELVRERDRFESLFETLPEPVALLSGEDRIGSTVGRVNAAFEDVFGYEEGEIRGEHLNDLIVPDGMEDEARRIDRKSADGDLSPAEVRRQTADGELRDFLLLTTRLSEIGEDDVGEGFAIYADITDQKEARRELERQRTRFETLFRTLPEPTAILSGADGPTIKEANPAFEDVFGYDSDAVRGADINDLIVPSEHEDEAGRIDDSALDGDILRREVERETAGGDRRNFLMLATGDVSTEPGDFSEGYVIYADITERKERERKFRRSQRHFEAVLDTPSSFIGVLEPDGTIRNVNQTALEFVDADLDTVEGRPVWETPWWTHSEDLQRRLRAWIEQAASGEYVWFEADHYAPDGEEVTVDGVVRPVFDADGEIMSLIIEGRDITERVEAEQELRRQNERLEKFAGVVSHDLRNPLNVAEGRLELARTECESEHLDAMARALDRMSALIDDILALAREGDRASEIEPVDLAELSEDCWQTVDTAGASLSTATDRTLRADRGRLKRLMENLVRNAVEHGGGDVTITVGDLADGAGFYVEDDGPGIPGDEREQVFESGYSASNGSTGFGLSIVEEIANAHGWEIDVTDAEDGGARFEITDVEFV